MLRPILSSASMREAQELPQSALEGRAPVQGSPDRRSTEISRLASAEKERGAKAISHDKVFSEAMGMLKTEAQVRSNDQIPSMHTVSVDQGDVDPGLKGASDTLEFVSAKPRNSDGSDGLRRWRALSSAEICNDLNNIDSIACEKASPPQSNTNYVVGSELRDPKDITNFSCRIRDLQHAILEAMHNLKPSTFTKNSSLRKLVSSLSLPSSVFSLEVKLKLLSEEAKNRNSKLIRNFNSTLKVTNRSIAEELSRPDINPIRRSRLISKLATQRFDFELQTNVDVNGADLKLFLNDNTSRAIEIYPISNSELITQISAKFDFDNPFKTALAASKKSIFEAIGLY
jgi:hypothetical protein